MITGKTSVRKGGFTAFDNRFCIYIEVLHFIRSKKGHNSDSCNHFVERPIKDLAIHSAAVPLVAQDGRLYAFLRRIGFVEKQLLDLCLPTLA
jgi:hypothetical protein